MNKSSARLWVMGGLFVVAILWVSLMGLVTLVVGGARASGGIAPTDDGSVKSQLTNIDRGKDFQISLALKVTDKADQVLAGLTERDIEVYEDDKLVETKNFQAAGKGAIRLCLVIDASRSMNGIKINEARKASQALLLMLTDNDWVGVYFFNDPLFENKQVERVPIEPFTRPQLVKAWDAVRDTGLGEGSPMTGTMAVGLDALNRVSGRRVMIVMTDGMDTGERPEVEKGKQGVIAKAQEYKIPLYMVNTSTETADIDMMKELAEKSGGQYIGVPDPTKLKEIFESIGKSLQNEYTLTYVSPNPVEDGQKRNVTVYVRSGAVGTRAKGDYAVPGVISTGAGNRGLGIGTMALIFVTLAALLGLLLGAPAVLGRKSAGQFEAVPQAGPAPVATPAPRPASPPQPGAASGQRPPAANQPKRPAKM